MSFILAGHGVIVSELLILVQLVWHVYGHRVGKDMVICQGNGMIMCLEECSNDY